MSKYFYNANDVTLRVASGAATLVLLVAAIVAVYVTVPDLAILASVGGLIVVLYRRIFLWRRERRAAE